MSEHDVEEPNDQLILICGYSSSGKSASLKDIKNQENWLYLNTEAGKRLPFKNKFRNMRVTDPYQIFEAFDYATNDDPEIEGIVIDSMTFLMDMYETMYVLGAANTMKAWGDFAQFFKKIMQEKVTTFGKPVIITAHIKDDLDEKNMEMKTAVPIKGSLKNNGVEAYFSIVVYAKRMALKDLKDYKSDLLTITEEDELLGYKHVFQTRPTKTTTGERIRSPMELFTREQTYMDNNAQILLEHLHNFYA